MEGLGKLGLVFLLSIFLLLSLSQCLNSVEEDANSLKLELIHRHAHPQLNSKPKTQLERVKELHHNDMIRQNMIAHRRRLAQNPPENMGTVRGGNAGLEMQIYSASDYGLGQYFVSFNVGTPPQKFTLVVDTGSDLTWMNCRYRCGERCRENARINRRPVFWADLSSSFRPVPCLTRMCKVELSGLFSLNACPTPHTPCGFDFRYVDGSDTLGFFANETVSVDLTDGRTTSLHGVLVGCSDSFKGANFDKGTADGVMGLANGKYSFTTIATQQFGGKFSYCLVDHLSHKNVTNYLVFGSNKRETSLMGRTRHAKLELNLIPPFYAINVVGISVGKKMVNVPVMAWDAMQGGGMILDSGMSLTLLSEPAYRPVMFALEASLTEYERVKLVGVPMEYCFNSTGFEETAVPKLVFHFVHGARFEPFVKSYIIDVAVGVKCLGIVSGTWPASSVIGNIMQQNHLWEFDLVGMKLGFTRSTCT